MKRPRITTRRRWLAPEVVQTSAMDCGPAALKCLLEGFGVSVSYGRLREACQTDVDGTSIDTIETIAAQLGLEAEQVMLPEDHLLLAESQALPAIVIIRNPNGSTHFVVVWRRHGPIVQVMDPGIGRRWMSEDELRAELYRHALPIPAAAWRDWAGSDSYLNGLKRRMSDAGVTGGAVDELIEQALADEGWRSLATLDAATRMTESIARSGGVKRGGQSAHVLKAFFSKAVQSAEIIPASYWMARPAAPSEDGEEQVMIAGAVLVQARGRRAKDGTEADAPALSPELAAALEEKPSRPGRELFALLRRDGLMAPVALLAALLMAAGGLLVEAALFQGLFNFSRHLNLTEQRLGAVAALVVFSLALLCLELPIAAGLLRAGRRLEVRLRLAFLEKIPRLGDRYFQSRLISDMAERNHSAQTLRMLPTLGGRLLRLTFELALTAAGIIWLDPHGVWVAATAAVIAVALPLAMQSRLTERDLRVRSHNGALGRFYLDAMLGLVAVRTHGAAMSLRREHEGLLVEWMRASSGLLRAALTVEAIEALSGFGLAAWLLFDHLSRGGGAGSALLLVYWALNLPALGQEIALIAQQYPAQRNVTLRALEPLGAPEESVTSSRNLSGNDENSWDKMPSCPTFSEEGAGERGSRKAGEKAFDHSAAISPTLPPSRSHVLPLSRGAALSFENVSVLAGGHLILNGIDLEIEAGSHVAIVGSSGAGKSSFVGLLLGWHRAAAGRVLVDGEELSGDRLAQLRVETAWVDPAIQLWNRSLIDNLLYGSTDHESEQSGTSNGRNPQSAIGSVIESADLRRVLEKLPDGLQTGLGEGGALVSGGEGQRVRLGRAMLRRNARLVILDEPFRGLDREKRRALMERARELWSGATLLCITHDVGETMNFERALVIEGGQIVEDGSPQTLIRRPDSRYSQLLDAEDSVRAGMWGAAEWRRLRMDGGQVVEERYPDQLAESRETFRASGGKAAMVGAS
ncbi:MAG: cysteine peptidase family C39 domain-containing protein [Acidobacteria bacterium]|nr:cysteine peptidase family C39 domain-containing protein [Acidobacteriota bacterium]